MEQGGGEKYCDGGCEIDGDSDVGERFMFARSMSIPRSWLFRDAASKEKSRNSMAAMMGGNVGALGLVDAQ